MVTERRYSSNFTAKNVLLTFQMEQHFIYREFYVRQPDSTHKVSQSGIFTIFHRSTHISSNIGPKILKIILLSTLSPLLVTISNKTGIQMKWDLK